MATDLAPVGLAAPPQRAITSAMQAGGSGGSATPWSMNREELRHQIDLTSKALEAADGRFTQLEQNLVLAASATEELRTETYVVGEETLRYAIEGYQHAEIPTGLLAASDLTESMRATALGGAAVSSDTEGFDTYRDLRKDLELEEVELVERELEVADAAAEVDSLEGQLQSELLVFGEMEERRLQSQAAVTQVIAANRAQARGRKQGYYLDLCPVDGPHSFIDSWGFSRSGGRRHEGVDIMADIGVPLVAPVSGEVQHYNNSLGGQSYRLWGPNGIYFYGTHLSQYEIKEGYSTGDRYPVAAGEVIGYVGDTGNARGIPHLHFEIHPGGQGAAAINPFIDTAAVCSGAQY
jgi:murein DD-endopeptidase MepM/ murein hydrolase activator NlpD